MTTFDFGDGNGPVPAYRHKNPDKTEGGWVARTAQVASTVHLGRMTRVYGEAVVQGAPQILGRATIRGEAQIKSSGVSVYGGAVIEGKATIHDSANVGGDAVIKGNTLVCGDASVTGDVIVSGGSRIGGTAHIEGGASSRYLHIRGSSFFGAARVEGNGTIEECSLDGHAKVSGSPVMYRVTMRGVSEVKDSPTLSEVKLDGRVGGKTRVENSSLSGGAWVLGNAKVEHSTLIGVSVGRSARIINSHIQGPTPLRATVTDDAVIKESVVVGSMLLRGSTRLEGCRLEGNVYLENVTIKGKIASGNVLVFTAMPLNPLEVTRLSVGNLPARATQPLNYCCASFNQDHPARLYLFESAAPLGPKGETWSWAQVSRFPLVQNGPEASIGSVAYPFRFEQASVDRVSELISKGAFKIPQTGFRDLEEFQRSVNELTPVTQALIMYLSHTH